MHNLVNMQQLRQDREGPNSISSAIKQESPHDFYFKAAIANVKIRPWSPEQEEIRRTVLPVLGQQMHFPELSQTRRSVVAELFVACEVRDAVGWGGGDRKCVFAICRGCGQDRMENFYKQQLYKFLHATGSYGEAATSGMRWFRIL